MPNENDCIDKKKYQALIGSLIYTVTGTSPDIVLALASVKQFRSKPGRVHWKNAKRKLRCFKGILDWGILFYGTRKTEKQLRGFTGAGRGSDLNGCKSCSDYVYMLFGGTIS